MQCKRTVFSVTSRVLLLAGAVGVSLVGCNPMQQRKSWQRVAAEKAFESLQIRQDDEWRGLTTSYIKALLSLERGGDPDRQFAQGRTLLMMAIIRGDKEIVGHLLSFEVYSDVNCTDNDGNTPLIFACERGAVDIVKKLVAAGAQVNQQNQKGMTAMMACAEKGNLELFKLLKNAGADPRLTDGKGWRWGNYASKGGHEYMISDIADWMIKEGGK